MLNLFLLFLLTFTAPVWALEVQGLVTKTCQRQTGIVGHASAETVEMIGLDGRFHAFPIADIDSVFIFNIIENPFTSFTVDAASLRRLKSIYVDDDPEARTLAFPVRFIEDLIIFYSLDGKSHVHRMADIYKLRPAPESALGEHRPPSHKNPGFAYSSQSAKCDTPASRPTEIKPTRVLADKISIAEFFSSFEQGYDSLESFQERTYLYAKPVIFEPRNRLGLVFSGQREEPSIPAPVYFQWSTGEPYRFQSYNVLGMKSHEFTPNTEPVFALRSDVKSHAFHALFVGNVAGLPAGNAVFSGSAMKLTGNLTVQPAFNYLAMMGGDYGPFSASVGFYYPTFGIKVRDQIREVRGSSASYAFRGMYTKRELRLRAIGSVTSYQSSRATEDDVKGSFGEFQNDVHPENYKFNAVFLRAGVDYDLSPRLRVSLDGIYVGGNYKEFATYNDSMGNKSSGASDIDFKKFTTQFQVRRAFGNYVALAGYVNLVQNNYDSNFLNKDLDREQRETNFFGTLEFIF